RRTHVESWVKGMSREYMPNTTRMHFQLVSAVLRGAVADGVIVKNPAAGVRIPKREAAESTMTIPSPEEVGSVIDAAEEWFQPYIALCAFAGLRRGEACGIQLADIDFLGKTIVVVRKIQHTRWKKPVVMSQERGWMRSI